MPDIAVFDSLYALPGGAARPDLPGAPEYLASFLSGERVRVERIVSWNHATPAGEWYDQDEDEWCVVLEGSARLALDDGREIALERGMSAFLPRHLRHRVQATSAPCVWLAVFGAALSMDADPGEGVKRP